MTTESMFEAVKKKIGERLGSIKAGVDVRVIVDKTPYGIWVWDEGGKEHVQMKNQEILKSLGASQDVRDYIEGLETVQLEWKEVLGPDSSK